MNTTYDFTPFLVLLLTKHYARFLLNNIFFASANKALRALPFYASANKAPGALLPKKHKQTLNFVLKLTKHNTSFLPRHLFLCFC
jgi:hypothetical protein